jgi:hypothetical protein
VVRYDADADDLDACLLFVVGMAKCDDAIIDVHPV